MRQPKGTSTKKGLYYLKKDVLTIIYDQNGCAFVNCKKLNKPVPLGTYLFLNQFNDKSDDEALALILKAAQQQKR